MQLTYYCTSHVLQQFKSAMSNPRSDEDFVRPSLVFTVVKVSCKLTTCLCFDNFEFDISDAGDTQCHFITYFTIAVRIFQYISLS